MGRKKKIQELNQVDGKDHRFQPTASVDSIFGYEQSKFPTDNAKEYEETLNQMNKFDLQQEATRLGQFPTDAKHVQIERIMTEFQKYQNGILASRSPNRHQLNISKIGRDILSEGA